MKISQKMARRIVGELEGVIKYKINLMDEKGYILASTDNERIGSFHEGAREVVKKGLMYLNVQDNYEFEGSREGINLPIVLKNKIVGVVGITGKINEVESLGQVIKKMTEILLLNELDKEIENTREKIRGRFIEEWLMNDDINKKSELIKRGIKLGYNMQIQRRVLIIELNYKENYIDTDIIQEQIEHMNKVLKKTIQNKRDCIVSPNISQTFCLIPKCEDSQVRSLAHTLDQKVRQECGLSLYIGVDSYDAKKPHISYAQAQKALIASKNSNNNINLYSDLTFELLLKEVPLNTKIEFIKKIFPGHSIKNIEENIDMLKRYYLFSGSLAKTANDLFIHTNTLQYRLKKIKQSTGYDPRDLNDAAYFIIVIYILEEGQIYF